MMKRKKNPTESDKREAVATLIKEKQLAYDPDRNRYYFADTGDKLTETDLDEFWIQLYRDGFRVSREMILQMLEEKLKSKEDAKV